MSFIARIRKQTAVYWKKTGVDRFGDIVYADPVEIKCRWTIRDQAVITKEGEEFASGAVVFVDRTMGRDDRLMLGTLESDTPADPLKASGQAYEVWRFDDVPDLKNKHHVLAVYLR